MLISEVCHSKVLWLLVSAGPPRCSAISELKMNVVYNNIYCREMTYKSRAISS